MSSELDTLLAKARQHRMTAEEREAQRRSFAYGNVHLHNDQITRETIDEAAHKLPASPVRLFDTL